jgi:hypothetical protein
VNPSKLAELISEIFGPHLWMPVLLFLLIFRTGLSSQQITVLLPSLLFLLIFIPFFYLHLALRMGWVSHWDLPKKEERRGIMIIFVICALLSFVLINNYGTPLFGNLFVIFLGLGFLISLITVFWKISLHMVLDTTGILLINYLFNWQFLFLFVLIPVVDWARLRLKRHTPLQILAGTLLSILVFFSGLSYFNYL